MSSWAVREARYAKKFAVGRKYIWDLFKGLDTPEQVEQIAIFVFASKSTHATLELGRVLLVSDLLEEIFVELRSKSIFTSMIGEDKPILRTLQFVAEYRNSVFKVLSR